MNLFPLTLAAEPHGAARLYQDLFGFEVIADVGWYVQLGHPAQPDMQLAFMSEDHHSIPEAHRLRPAGVVITIEVSSADELRERAGELDLTIHTEVTDEEWGQRHFITEDRTGLLVDIVQSIPPTPAFLAQHGISPEQLA